jgi:hypothetical protein
LLTPLPGAVTAFQLLPFRRTTVTGRFLGRFLGLPTLTFFGLPAFFVSLLPALIGLAMDVSIAIRKDIIGTLTCRTGLATITGSPG